MRIWFQLGVSIVLFFVLLVLGLTGEGGRNVLEAFGLILAASMLLMVVTTDGPYKDKGDRFQERWYSRRASN